MAKKTKTKNKKIASDPLRTSLLGDSALPTIGQPPKVLKKAPTLGVPVYKTAATMQRVTSYFFFDDAGNRISSSDAEFPDGFVNEEVAREWLFEAKEVKDETVLELRFVTRYVK